MLKSSWLTALEASAVVIWLGLAAALVSQDTERGALIPIDPAALVTGESQDVWMGIYFDGQKVGYAVNSETPTVDGGVLMRHRSAFTLAAFGQIKQVITAGNAVMDKDLTLRRFDFLMSSDPVRIAVRGEVQDKLIVMEVFQAGEAQRVELPITAPPQMSLSLPAWFARQTEVRVGQRFDVPYFDPVSLSQDVMTVKVVDVELTGDGEEAYWLERSFGEATTRVLVNTKGETLREESALGMSMVRQTAAEAQAMPSGAEPVDIIALSAVKLDGRLDDPRGRKVVVMEILGVEPSRVPHGPPYQTVEGAEVRVMSPLLAELPGGLAREETNPTFADTLAATPFLPVTHPELREKAKELVGQEADRVIAARLLNEWVFNYVEKAPTIGVPNALEVLHTRQGDCNEHTALYVALARAAGIPARIAAGVVFSDRIGATGAFYYHAWPEIYLGSAGWVPVDPTFGQFPADATHVKLVEGDLDRQIEIMGVMGRLGFRLIEAR
jgi:hypothetical protein